MPGGWGFCGPFYKSQSQNVDDEDAMNCYCEQSQSPNAKTPIALLHTPGKTVFANLAGQAAVPCLFTLNSRTFAATGILYEILANGTVVNRGSLGGTPLTPTMMTANQTQLVILNNGALYVFVFSGAVTVANVTFGAGGTNYAPGDTGVVDGINGGSGATYTVLTVGGSGAVTSFSITPGSGYVVENSNPTSVLTGNGDGTLEIDINGVSDNYLYAVPAANFVGLISQIDFCDGYVIATIQNSHTFQQSNLEDATVWSGLNVATLSYFPDNIVSMKVNVRTIQFSSAKKSVWYYNSGAGFPVFIPIQGAFAEVGSAATFSMTQLDNSVFWLSQDERGFLIAMRTNGYGGQRVSTHAVELAWQSYGTTADAVGWTYQEYGHTFYMVYFPTANATWGYDVATGYWHRRGFWVAANGTYIADRAMSHTLNFGVHLVGDWASGAIYQLSSQFCTDFGNMIRGYRRSPTISKENKWVYFRQVEFDVEVGLGPSAADVALWTAVQGSAPLLDGDGNTRPPQVMLRWSDDAGKTWSNTYILSIGQIGNYDARCIKRMLGRARKRVWEVAWVDPVPYRFADAYLEAEPAVA